MDGIFKELFNLRKQMQQKPTDPFVTIVPAPLKEAAMSHPKWPEFEAMMKQCYGAGWKLVAMDELPEAVPLEMAMPAEMADQQIEDEIRSAMRKHLSDQLGEEATPENISRLAVQVQALCDKLYAAGRIPKLNVGSYYDPDDQRVEFVLEREPEIERIFPLTATGGDLGRIAAMWGLVRELGETDEGLRQRVVAEMDKYNESEE